MSGQGLTTVPQGIPTTTLVIDLSYNSITTVSNGTLTDLALLVNLDLSNNQITFVEAGSFLGLQLETLNLNHNQIGVPPFYPGLLRALYLSHNNLTEVRSGQFQQNALLETLDLSDNLITSIYSGAFQDDFLSSLLSLNLTGNPAGCTVTGYGPVVLSCTNNLAPKVSTTPWIPSVTTEKSTGDSGSGTNVAAGAAAAIFVVCFLIVCSLFALVYFVAIRKRSKPSDPDQSYETNALEFYNPSYEDEPVSMA
jgi:hypothetical protein